MVAAPFPMELNSITIRLSDATKIIQLPDGMYMIDFARVDIPITQRVIVFISMKGEVEYYAPRSRTRWGFHVDLNVANLPPPKDLIELHVMVHTPALDPREAFARAKEVAMQTIVFDDERLYDMLVAWCAYTWVRGLFPKNVNIYVTGFPGTGKSQVLNFIKHFARYPTYFDPGSEKSYKWHVANTIGTLMIDEGEYLSRSSIARLRKYHEADVLESRMLGLPMIGLTMVELRVDTPIAVAATHLPADTAFLQRGYIIRMYKRKPRIKDFNLIPGLRELSLSFAKTWLVNWFKVFMSMQEVYRKLTEKDMDERIKDLVLPIATILNVVERDWEWVIEVAERSFGEANYVTPETMVFLIALDELRNTSKKVGDKYVFSIQDVYNLIDELSERFRANAQRVRYLLQYIFAGCGVARCGTGLCFVCDKETVDHVVETSLPSIPVEAARGGRRRRRRRSRKGRVDMPEDREETVEVVLDGGRTRVVV